MTSKKLSYTLFTEKYRPETVDDMILPEGYKKFFKKIVEEREIPNLLLYSSTPGTGKTSISKALCNEIGADYLYINISDHSGVDTLRESISKFASGKSINGKKVVILDEFDGGSMALQKALRAEIEHYHTNCRFIVTCNYVNKIIPALRSRLMEYDFNMNTKTIRDEVLPKVVKRICSVLKFEEIEYKEDTIKELVEELYPDIRKLYSLIQQYSKTNGIIDENIFGATCVDSELYNLILAKKLTLARKFVMESGYSYEDLYSNLFNEFVPMVDDKQKQAEIILTIAKYQYQSNFCSDKEIQFAACLIDIMKEL